jgi:uncharacterized protein YraI
MPNRIIRVALALPALSFAALLACAAASAPAQAWPAETRSELAVREGPGMDFPHIEVVPAGVVVDVRHCSGGGWCRIAARDGLLGYVRARNLERIGDVYLGPRVELYVGIGPRPVYRPWYGPPIYYRHHGHGHRRW